jgi:hypothetical protein
VQGFFIGQPMTAKQITESLGTMPYVKAYGKTALSTLWERASNEPETLANDKEFTTHDINATLEIRERQLAENSPGYPQLGQSPMAPRVNKLTPIELPTIFRSVEKPPKKPAKPRKKAAKKTATKKPAAKPSGVPSV